MGAWGHGILEDDTALDFLDELRDGGRPFEAMRAALEAAVAAEYLEYDAGQAALVSAGIVDTVLGGASLQAGDDEELAEWLRGLSQKDATPLRALAARACGKLLGGGSELKELWAENEELYPSWKAGIEDIARRLGAP